MGGTIVCGVTRSPAARDAAELAAALAARLEMRLVLVHVSRDREAAVAETPGAEDVRVVHGSRAEAIAEVAAEEGADLIVLGSRTGGLRGGLLRSGLARELEQVTPVPVLVAPPSTRARSGHRLALAVAAGAAGR
ncbi:MAG TPA: universal stress protein [Gaiellales bacterium]|nr:universal stress protein [Gaiellales bacterium]